MRSASRDKHVIASLLLLGFHFSPLNASALGPSVLITPPGKQAASDTTTQVELLTAQLKSGDEEKRREAAMVLSSIKGDAAIAALATALNDSSPRVRAAAINGLSDRAVESIASLLVERLTQDKEQFVRKAAAYGLARFHNSQRTEALMRALSDKDLEVRGAAAVSLGDHADPSAIVALATALKDKSELVRAQAARALGVNGRAAAQSVAALITLLTGDPESEVKRQAATALGLIGDRSALPALEQARRDKDPYLAEAALEATRRIEGNK